MAGEKPKTSGLEIIRDPDRQKQRPRSRRSLKRPLALVPMRASLRAALQARRPSLPKSSLRVCLALKPASMPAEELRRSKSALWVAAELKHGKRALRKPGSAPLERTQASPSATLMDAYLRFPPWKSRAARSR